MKNKTTVIALLTTLLVASIPTHASQQQLSHAQSQLKATIRETTKHVIPDDIIRLIGQLAAKRFQRPLLTGHTSNIRKLLFTPDSTKIVSIDYNGRIVVWETYTGRGLYGLECNQNDTSPVALSSNSQLMAVASTHAGRPCYIRNVSDGAIMTSITPPAANIGITPVAFTPNGRALSYIHSGSSELYLQNLTSKRTKASPCIIGKGLSAAFLGKDKLVLIAADASKQFWNFTTQSCERTIQDEEIMLCSNRSAYVTFCRSAARPMNLYNAQTHEKIREFHDSTNRYWKARFDQTGKKIVTTSKDSYIRIWDVQSGTCLQQVSLARNLPRDQPGYACPTHDESVFIIHMKRSFLVVNIDKQVVISGPGNTLRRMLGISPDHTMIAMEEITAASAIESKVSIRLFDLFDFKKALQEKIARQERRQQHISRIMNLLRKLPGITGKS